MNTNISESKGYSNLDFARALLELKNASGLSYMKIAVKAGVSDTYLVNIVQGKNLAPNDDNIRKIAWALGVAPEYFKEYRQRRLAEKLDTLSFHKTNYNVPLSEAEAKYLKKIIDDHFAAKKKKKNP
jgi:transcriptional regulator with XRE-family HTH domain